MPELNLLVADQQVPVHAYLFHPHPAGLPGSLADPALQGQRDRLGVSSLFVAALGMASGRQAQQKGHAHGGSKGKEGKPCCENRPVAAEGRHGPWRRSSDSTLITAVVRRSAACQDLTNAGTPVPLFNARVQVSLRPSVLDPAGEATRAAADRLGVEGVRRLRIGKAIDVDLEAPDRETAQARLELLSDRLLANPVIEDWCLDLSEAG
jgi:phosphoribosylformylglycinamidine synthase PurS subunit